MSATNRGSNRQPNDHYATPQWLIQAILPEISKRLLKIYEEEYVLDGLSVLEPACGIDKNIVNELYNLKLPWPLNITSGDITTGQDFLTYDYKDKFDLIITNPPYSLAFEFIQRALDLVVPGGLVVFLLRLNFLGSIKRAEFLRNHPPSVYVSPKRPSFVGKGTDATEYAWFIWSKPYDNEGQPSPELKILETDKLNNRKKD